jgi:nucleoid-associated protein YgaU
MLESSFLTNKWGPLPAWAWMGLGLGGALAVASWNKNRSADDGDGGGGGDVVSQKYELPDSIQPSYVFQNYDQDQTWINVPPAGGSVDVPPVAKPPTTKPPVTTQPVKPPVKPKPAPAPSGTYVTVVPFKKGQKKGTPSTLWGIAEKVYGKATQALWQQIWNAPQNAALKKKRGAPDKIQPGDRFWVPTK